MRRNIFLLAVTATLAFLLAACGTATNSSLEGAPSLTTENIAPAQDSAKPKFVNAYATW